MCSSDLNARHADLKANCWDIYGPIAGLSKCILGTPERIRVLVFLCASVDQLATTKLDAIDPAVALTTVAFSGSPRFLGVDEHRATFRLHRAVYVFSRGSGERYFHIEKDINAADALSPFD